MGVSPVMSVQLHTFVNPLTDLRRSPVASTSDRRFSHLYTGRKIYGPLNDSTEFNCHFIIMVYA